MGATAQQSPWDGAAFAEQLRHCWSRAAGSSVERKIRVGGQILRLCFAQSQLADEVMRSFGHIEVRSHVEADQTIRFWDTTSSGVTPPPPPWSASQYLARGEIDHGYGPQFHAWFSPLSGVFSFWDEEKREAICWYRDRRRIPRWERAAPLRAFFSWWGPKSDLQLAHAACVGNGEDGLLLIGRGGSGKSTTALSCARAGMTYSGDDNILVGWESGRPTAHSLYCTASLYPENFEERFSSMDVERKPQALGDDDKHLLLPSEWPLVRTQASARLRAIVVPRVTHAERAQLRAASKFEVLTALAPNSLLMTPQARGPHFKDLSRLTRALPGYVLELSEHPTTNIEALRALLD